MKYITMMNKLIMRFLCTIISIICFCSCADENRINSALENNPRTHTETLIFGTETTSGYRYITRIYINKFIYNGHSYIFFSDDMHHGGFVHDPDCECSK